MQTLGHVHLQDFSYLVMVGVQSLSRIRLYVTP